MNHPLRTFLLVLAAGGLAASAHAVGVTLAMTHAESRICHPDRYGEGEWCEAAQAATIAPVMPGGSGDLQLDAAGTLIVGSLSLGAFSLDGLAVPAWSGDLQAGLPTPATGWPAPGGVASEAFLSVSRFTSQSDFAGTLDLVLYESGGQSRRWNLELAFASVPGGVVACPGEKLFRDDDGDGKINARDSASWQDDRFGDAIDSEGRTPAQFCSLVADALSSWQRKRSCERLDYRNDEPALRRPGDCAHLAPTRDSRWSCSPAELVFRSAPPAFAARACLGYPVVDDADADGEPDATDACRNTPSGSPVDGDGCSAQEFCSQQSVLSCRRADFRNDEPLAKLPGDCARTRSKPRACAAVAP